MTDSNIQNIDTLSNLIEYHFNHSDSISGEILQFQRQITEQLKGISNNDNEILFLCLGALLGLVLTLIWNYILILMQNRNFRKKLKNYEGLYLAFNKYETADNIPFRCFELKRNKNKLNILNGISLLGYEDYTGEINMLEYNLNFGNGYFQHIKAPDNFIGFGFLEVQLTENEILVHETIYNDKGRQNSDAYRWIKQDPQKKKEIIEKHRLIQKGKYKTIYNQNLKNVVSLALIVFTAMN